MIYGKSSYACCVQLLLMLWKVEQTRLLLCALAWETKFCIHHHGLQ